MKLFLILLLLTLPALAQDAVTQASSFSDAFGNRGSFWTVRYQGKSYRLLKLKSPDRAQDADCLFDDATLAELESKVLELKHTPNTLKADGFQVVWSRKIGDATVRTLLGRLGGVKAKILQIEQNKANEPKSEHQICMDQIYGDFTRALDKARKAKP